MVCALHWAGNVGSWHFVRIRLKLTLDPGAENRWDLGPAPLENILPRYNSVDGFALPLGHSQMESNELGQRVRPMSAPARSGHAALLRSSGSACPSEQLGDESYSYMAGPKGFTPKVKIDMDDVTRC